MYNVYQRIIIEGKELLADLVLLDVIDFDVTFGMDWLAQHYTSLDYREKVVIFRILNDSKFRFRGGKSSMPQNIISTITARMMLRRECKGYLAMVRM